MFDKARDFILSFLEADGGIIVQIACVLSLFVTVVLLFIPWDRGREFAKGNILYIMAGTILFISFIEIAEKLTGVS